MRRERFTRRRKSAPSAGSSFNSVVFLRTRIDLLYTSALILADCATIGGVIYLIYEGAQQVDRTVQIPEILITSISLVCFIILESLFLAFGSSFEVFLYWIHLAVVILGILMLFIRYWKGYQTHIYIFTHMQMYIRQ